MRFGAADYSTGSAVSSAAILSERRKRRSLAVTSKLRRGCNDPRRRRHLRQRRRLRSADEADDGLECDLHFKSCGPSFLSARFDLRIFRDRSGNRVGQLSREPVHDVVHPASSLTPPGRVPGRFPIRTCLHQGGGQGPGAKLAMLYRKNLKVWASLGRKSPNLSSTYSHVCH